MKIAKWTMRTGGLKRQLREEEMVSNFKNEDVKRRKDSGTFIVDGRTREEHRQVNPTSLRK